MATTAQKLGLTKLKETAGSKVQVVYNGGRHRNSLGEAHGPAVIGGGGGGHDGEETWIFSYADMITILLMFFLVLLSISSIDPKKFSELRENISTDQQKDAQKAKAEAQQPVQATSNHQPLAPALGVGTVPFKLLADKANDASSSDSQTQLLAAIQVLLEAIDPKSLEKAADQAEQFDQMKAQILKIRAVAEKRAEVQETESQEIKVFFRSESFFDAQNRLTPSALRTLSDLAKSTLNLDPYPKISIATYVSETQVPSPAAAIEQTTEQAMAVFRALAQEKISPQLMSIAGYGQDKPMLQEVDAYGNKVQQAAKRNSRVEITIKRRRDYR